MSSPENESDKNLESGTEITENKPSEDELVKSENTGDPEDNKETPSDGPSETTTENSETTAEPQGEEAEETIQDSDPEETKEPENQKEAEPEKSEKPEEPEEPEKPEKPKKRGRKKKEMEIPEDKEPKAKDEPEEEKKPSGETEGEGEIAKEVDQTKADTEVKGETKIEADIRSDELAEAVEESDLESDYQLELDELPEQERDQYQKLEAKLIEYNDFIPTKDTITVITHLDVDGVLCVAAIKRMLKSKSTSTGSEAENEELRIFFTTPAKTFNTLAKSIPDLNKITDEDFSIGQLYIADLSLNKDTQLGSSIYDSVKWFDHHEIDSNEQYSGEIENLEQVIDPSAESTTSLICRYFKLDDELGNIADEIDMNDVKSDNAQRIREIVGALKMKYSGIKLKKLLYGLAHEIAEDINNINNEIYDPLIEEYRKWLDDFNQFTNEKIQLHDINGNKVGIIEIENMAPVYAISNNLKSHPEAPMDIITVMIHKYFRIGKDRNNKFKNKKYTKLEFRTQTDQDILDLAKLFGGGGHKYASGATVMEGLDINDLIKAIETFYTPITKPGAPVNQENQET